MLNEQSGSTVPKFNFAIKGTGTEDSLIADLLEKHNLLIMRFNRKINLQLLLVPADTPFKRFKFVPDQAQIIAA